MNETVKISEGIYQVGSFSDPTKSYIVNMRLETCSCPHATYRGAQCKHIRQAQAQQQRDHAAEILDLRAKLSDLYGSFEARAVKSF